MTAPDSVRQSRKRRLERAGYVALTGWVPAAYAATVMAQVEMHREDVERVADEPVPRGRPRKDAE